MTRAFATPLLEWELLAQWLPELPFPGLPTKEQVKAWLQGLSWDKAVSWAERTVVDNPERLRLMVGVAVALAGLLVLALSLRRRRRISHADLVRQVAAAGKPEAAQPVQGAVDAPMTRAPAANGNGAALSKLQSGPPAWLLAEPAGGSLDTSSGTGWRVPLSATLLRIGRHEENDVRFEDKTVHRYHAVVHRTAEGDFVITDLSGIGGNGVYVNGARIEQVPLRSGDLVELGIVRLRFHEARLH